MAVFGCFAPGRAVPVLWPAGGRYSPGEIAGELGRDWTLLAEDRETHTTPAGPTQPFTRIALRRTR